MLDEAKDDDKIVEGDVAIGNESEDKSGGCLSVMEKVKIILN